MHGFPGNVKSWMYWGPLADLWLRPWFDRVALDGITRWFMPMSRAWAGARAARGNVERFRDSLSMPRDGMPEARWAVSQVSHRDRSYASAERRWSELAFGKADGDDTTLAQALAARDKAAQYLSLSRGAFLPLVLRGHVPPVLWEVPSREDVALRHGARLTGEDAAFATARMPTVEESRRLPGADGQTQYWIRFPSPVGDSGGPLSAYVREPADFAAGPTLIFLHGICYEAEFMPRGQDPIGALVDQGFRLVMPEAPWHGRRRLPGHYGGEPVIGRAPLGFLTLFEAWVREVAVMIDWARSTAPGRVALGGISLGALTSQLTACAAREWPARLRPDALLLVATSGEVGALMTASSLGRDIGLPEELTAQGWTADSVARWLPLAEPQGMPSLDPDAIVMVLGREDRITPYSGGVALADRWSVPAANRFVWDRGHFSTGLGIGADSGPMARLDAILRRPR